MTYDPTDLLGRGSAEREDWRKYHPRGHEKVLLRSREQCLRCAGVYLSLWPLRQCDDHAGLLAERIK